MSSRVDSSKVVLVSLFAATVAMLPSRADAGTASKIAPLCTATDGVCEYTNADAPVLRANVCWNKTDVRLMPAVGCPAGSYPYYVDYGEVIDPMLGLVVAYIPLPDACDLGYCFDGAAFDGGPLEGEALCCETTENCVEVNGTCGGDIVFCEAAATNDDGTLACFD